MIGKLINVVQTRFTCPTTKWKRGAVTTLIAIALRMLFVLYVINMDFVPGGFNVYVCALFDKKFFLLFFVLFNIVLFHCRWQTHLMETVLLLVLHVILVVLLFIQPKMYFLKTNFFLKKIKIFDFYTVRLGSRLQQSTATIVVVVDHCR